MKVASQVVPPRLGWVNKPAGWFVTLLVVAILCAAPAWLMYDRLDGFSLKQDDFVYLAQSRNWPTLRQNLMTPHNAHVVPLFRLLTYALITANGGRLTRMQDVFLWASYGVLVATMLATGLLVARETRNRATGLCAMAGLGLSSVIEPAVTWYAASQAVWAALAVVFMLLALQAWKRGGTFVWLILGGVAAFAAPLLWSGGYVAGPVGLAYLGVSPRAGSRRTWLIPPAAVVLTAVAVIALAGQQLARTETFGNNSPKRNIRPVKGLIYATEAVPQELVFHNLGLNVAVSAPQGVVLCLLLAAFWACTRGFPPRPNALEAAGAVMAWFGYLLVYSARGYVQFESLRGLGWYSAIPQVGAILFAAGWWVGRTGNQRQRDDRLPTPTRTALAAVLTGAAVLIVLHKPLIQSTLLASVYPPSAAEVKKFPTRYLQLLRAGYLAAEPAGRQQRFLARLDGIQHVATRLGVGRTELRNAFGRVVGPGMPEQVRELDIFDLMVLPHSGLSVDPAIIKNSLGDWVALEPEPRPYWIVPEEPWPPEGARP